MRIVVQAAGLVAAIAMGVHGSLLLNDPFMHRFNRALVWYGFALLALAVFAWDIKLHRPSGDWRRSVRSFLWTHRIEIILFALVLAFGIFMRLYRYGIIPPHNALAFEENINGGLAYRALNGEPQVLFGVNRYASSIGFLVFGSNTLGLRFFFIAAGIITIPILYLLLRELVSVQIALFVTLLFSAAYWPSFLERHAFEVGMMMTMLLAYLLIRGIRTHSAMVFLGVGILCSLISNEYENFKPVPLYAVGFMGLLAVWQIAPAAIRGLRPLRSAVTDVGRKAWRPALAFAVAAGITAGPLIMGTHLGKDWYLSSLHRQEGDRLNRGTPGLIAPNWDQQAKWAVGLFLPFGPDKARDRLPLSLPGTRVLDPLSATLLVAGVAYAGLMLLRPYRVFFLGWFLATLTGGALLLSNWEPWKFLGLVPVGLVLAAFLLEDVRALWLRLARGRSFQPLLSVGMLAAAVFVCRWNADTLFNHYATNKAVLTEYTHGPSEWYALCDYLRSFGRDNYAYTFQSADTGFGFGKPHDTPLEQIGAWGDRIWVCHDLDGFPLAGSQESWPLTDIHSDPISLVFMSSADGLEALQASVEQGYPGATLDRITAGPLDAYYVVGYKIDSALVRSRQGLYAEYSPAGATQPTVDRVDDVSNLSWTETAPPLSPPFTVRWTGLVYLREGGPWLLNAVSNDTVRISLDGDAAYNANDVSNQLPLAKSLAAGWHTVEITLDKQAPGGAFLLRWVSSQGGISITNQEDFFALHSLTGWLLTRQFLLADGREVSWQRIDHSVEFASKGVVLNEIDERYGIKQGQASWQTQLVGETFSSWWSLKEAGNYRLTLRFVGGTMAVLMDGQQVLLCQSPKDSYRECATTVPVPAGRHYFEVRVKGDGVYWSGARLLISPPDGTSLEDQVEIAPF